MEAHWKYARCSFVVVKVFSKMMQEILGMSSIQPEQLYQMIMSTQIFRKRLKQSEMTIIQTLQTDGYSKLDVSLIYKIARFFNLIPPPLRKWGSKPLPLETEIGDDVERIRIGRNNFVHRVDCEMKDAEMTAFFDEFIQVAERVDSYLGNDAGHKDAIIHCQTCPYDSEMERSSKAAQDVESLEEKIQLTVDNKVIHVLYGNSFKELIDEVQKEECSSTSAVTFIVKGVKDSQEKTELLNSMKDQINSGSVCIEFKQARDGSILLFASIKTSVLENESFFLKEVAEFVQRFFKLGKLATLTEDACNIIIVPDEDPSEDLEDSSDDEISESGDILLDLEVSNEIFKTEMSIRQHFGGFATKMMNLTNGKDKIEGSDHVALLYPDKKGISKNCDDKRLETKTQSARFEEFKETREKLQEINVVSSSEKLRQAQSPRTDFNRRIFTRRIMGIRGLTSFIRENGSLQPYILKDTRVVIDGNNICHQLLYIGTCRHYGGNYIEIRQNAQSFFQALLKCNIKPYVVFDGDDDDKKLQNIITKYELQIKKNEEKPPKHMECFPGLAYESFKTVLKELNIPHLTCDGEADNQIAVLARQWNCPVISRDSDMYIFDLPGGFINFLDINLDQPTSDELNTRLYHASKFADSIGLHITLLPVAATVLGSLYDDIDDGVANLFFKRLGGKSSFANISNNFKYAFELLKNAKSQEIAIAILMQCVDETLPPWKTEDIKKNIYSSFSAYNAGTEFTGFDIAKYFEGKEYAKHHRCLPDCVIEKIRSCTLSRMPINVTLGRVILKPTFEHFDWLPIQHISRPLRQIIYGLVLKSCTNGVEYVTEIVRNKRLMTGEPIKPVVEVAGYGILPTLQEIDGQDKRNKTKLLAAIFTFDEKILESLPSESKVFALALKYFISNTCPHVTVRLKIYALCHVILLYREFPGVQSFYNMLSSSTGNEKQNVGLFHENLQRFHECLNMAYTINVLLGTPLKKPDPATVFDGILMYNLFLKEPTEYEVDQWAKTHFLKEQMLKLYNALLFILPTDT